MQEQFTPFRGARQHFVESLAYHPQAANAKNQFHKHPAEKAVGMRYIQPDRPYEIVWVKFDIDDSEEKQRRRRGRHAPLEHSAVRWLDLGLPRPHFIMQTSRNLGSQYMYGLAVPVLKGERSRTAPRKLFETVVTAYTNILEADAGYTGAGVKNPLHRAWNTLVYDGPLYTLIDLLDCLPERMRHTPQPHELVSEGRNTDLFARTRLWAYGEVYAAYRVGDYSRWHTAVLHETGHLNQYKCKLPRKEIESIARSVAAWTWKNAHNFQPRPPRPPAKRGKLYSWDRPTLTAEQARQNMVEGGRQGGKQGGVLGAPITHAIRRARTFDAITAAMGELAGLGILSPTHSQVADRAGVSVDTVKRFRRDQRQGMGSN